MPSPRRRLNPPINAWIRPARRLFLLAATLAFVSCDEDRADSSGPVDTYDAAAVEAMRAAKDSSFRSAESPLPDSLRASFAGLTYYPVDPSLALRVPLEVFEEPEIVKVAATGGDVRLMTRVGRFVFEIDGKPCTLSVFKSTKMSSGYLFVPFRDATNGSDTYEVGRYLDLEEQYGDEPYLLDFNLCYNPYCAYNESYTCPIVPEENVLSVAIRAGEKLPPLGGH